MTHDQVVFACGFAFGVAAGIAVTMIIVGKKMLASRWAFRSLQRLR